MEKVIRDGKVAVLYSRGYGAGWYSWNSDKELLYHPKLVEMVEAGRQEEITEEWVMENLGLEIYAGGAEGLTIMWIDEGTPFYIDEYDGAESIITSDRFDSVA